MKHLRTASYHKTFDLLTATRRAQAAMMTLRPGSASDDEPSNEHPRCEQWLYVISGMGVATIGRTQQSLRQVKLRQGSLLVIEQGELRQIKNSGRGGLRTLNLYVPPAYHPDGKPRSRQAGDSAPDDNDVAPRRSSQSRKTRKL